VKTLTITLAIALLVFVLAIGGCVYLFSPSPPKEAEVIKNFNEHRAAFEQLRTLLQADPNLSRHGQAISSPPEEIKQYQSLLTAVGNPNVYVWGKGRKVDVSFMVWGWGFAGNTEHMDLVWVNEQPTNLIPTLDGYRGQRVYPNTVVVYRHIDGQWYLTADW